MPEAPSTTAALLARATRIKTLPLAMAPVVVGSAVAVGRVPGPSWVWFVVAALTVAVLHAGAMVVNDLFDARTGADRIAGMDRGGVVTASGLLESKAVSLGWMASVGTVLYGSAAALGVIIGAGRVPEAIWLVTAGAGLGIGYCAGPVRYGYRGRGLGQLGLFAAYGPVASLGAYAVQAERLGADGAWAGVVPGLLVASVFTTADLLHHRADRAVSKHTPAAVLGPEGGLVVVAALFTAAYAALVVQVAVELFPAWALIGLMPALPLAAAWSRAFRDPNPQRALNLLGASLGAAVITSAVAALAAALA